MPERTDRNPGRGSQSNLGNLNNAGDVASERRQPDKANIIVLVYCGNICGAEKGLMWLCRTLAGK
jgi:hypothetical protein